jgi:hypothetical protein
MKFILSPISSKLNVILCLAFFSFFYFLVISQSINQNSKTVILVESGESKIYNSLEDNIKSFELDYVGSQITACNIKLQAIDASDVNNKIWVKRIKTEFLLLTKYL